MSIKQNFEPLTIRTLLALFAADVDIFLLKEEDQETDKDQVFTVAEIQEHLIKTIDKFNYNLRKLGYELDQPLGGRIPIDPYSLKKVLPETVTKAQTKHYSSPEHFIDDPDNALIVKEWSKDYSEMMGISLKDYLYTNAVNLIKQTG